MGLSRWLWPVVGGLAAVSLGACGSSGHSVVVTNASAGLTVDTAPASKAVSQVTWGLYRDVQTVDPIFGFDFPENTVDAALCDSLFRQQPDGSRAPGLALSVSSPTPTTDVLNLRPGVKFWDGHTMTSADVGVDSQGRTPIVEVVVVTVSARTDGGSHRTKRARSGARDGRDGHGSLGPRLPASAEPPRIRSRPSRIPTGS